MTAPNHDSLVFADPAELHPNEQNPRTDYGDLMSLIKSIAEVGMIEPIVVTKDPDGRLRIVAGHRRHRAALTLNLEQVPVRVLEHDDTAGSALARAMAENLARKDLTPTETGQGFLALHEAGWRQAIIAKAAGEKPSQVSKAIRVARAPDPVKKAVEDGQLGFDHAVELADLDEHDAARAVELMTTGDTYDRPRTVEDARAQVENDKAAEEVAAALEDEYPNLRVERNLDYNDRSKMATIETGDRSWSLSRRSVLHFKSPEEHRSEPCAVVLVTAAWRNGMDPHITDYCTSPGEHLKPSDRVPVSDLDKLAEAKTAKANDREEAKARKVIVAAQLEEIAKAARLKKHSPKVTKAIAQLLVRKTLSHDTIPEWCRVMGVELAEGYRQTTVDKWTARASLADLQVAAVVAVAVTASKGWQVEDVTEQLIQKLLGGRRLGE